MKINSAIKEYEVIYSDAFSFTKEIQGIENRFLVIDKNVYDSYREILDPITSHGQMLLFESLEENKSIDKALEICRKLMDLPSKRNTVLVSIGGGILQDVSGFAASILYRGIKWVFVPTTFLAQTDSCIGAKTSINYEGHKNILGTFYPPDKIYLDASFIKTLSERDYLSGVGEAIKIAIMSGEKSVSEMERDIDGFVDKDLVIAQKWAERSLLSKKKYIEEDEFDHGVRRLLNYGHTFGHALEKTSDYAIPHGQAISIGMMIANDISLGRKYLKPDEKTRLDNLIRRSINVNVKKGYFEKGFIEAMKKDKKRIGEGLAAILLKSGFELAEAHDIDEHEVSESVAHFLAGFGGSDL